MHAPAVLRTEVRYVVPPRYDTVAALRRNHHRPYMVGEEGFVC